MTNYRAILHSDLNGFYASVETMLNPALKNKPVAVCGSTETRHGIVLAKSEIAKKAGIKTGMANWQAKQLCPGLIMVPPQFDQYLKYSKLTQQIYCRFTDQVEPYGIDECWLDVTASQKLYGTPFEMAENIRQTVREELGLTVSVGISFNKIFAKLGSDLKKPDATTVISPKNFREIVWPLPVNELLFVGPSTTRKLQRLGITTIGQLATAPKEFLIRLLGKNGGMLWAYANGLDRSRVMPSDYKAPIKSVGHGTTCTSDLYNNDEAWKVLLTLSQDIGHRLLLHEKRARGVQISVKNNELFSQQFQMQLSTSTQSSMEIAKAARKLFIDNYQWDKPVRALAVRAINLESSLIPQQQLLFDLDTLQPNPLLQEKLHHTVEDIRSRFGKKAIFSASLLGDTKTKPDSAQNKTLPGLFYQ